MKEGLPDTTNPSPYPPHSGHLSKAPVPLKESPSVSSLQQQPHRSTFGVNPMPSDVPGKTTSIPSSPRPPFSPSRFPPTSSPKDPATTPGSSPHVAPNDTAHPLPVRPGSTIPVRANPQTRAIYTTPVAPVNPTPRPPPAPTRHVLPPKPANPGNRNTLPASNPGPASSSSRFQIRSSARIAQHSATTTAPPQPPTPAEMPKQKARGGGKRGRRTKRGGGVTGGGGAGSVAATASGGSTSSATVAVKERDGSVVVMRHMGTDHALPVHVKMTVNPTTTPASLRLNLGNLGVPSPAATGPKTSPPRPSLAPGQPNQLLRTLFPVPIFASGQAPSGTPNVAASHLAITNNFLARRTQAAASRLRPYVDMVGFVESFFLQSKPGHKFKGGCGAGTTWFDFVLSRRVLDVLEGIGPVEGWGPGGPDGTDAKGLQNGPASPAAKAADGRKKRKAFLMLFQEEAKRGQEMTFYNVSVKAAYNGMPEYANLPMFDVTDVIMAPPNTDGRRWWFRFGVTVQRSLETRVMACLFLMDVLGPEERLGKVYEVTAKGFALNSHGNLDRSKHFGFTPCVKEPRDITGIQSALLDAIKNRDRIPLFGSIFGSVGGNGGAGHEGGGNSESLAGDGGRVVIESDNEGTSASAPEPRATSELSPLEEGEVTPSPTLANVNGTGAQEGANKGAQTNGADDANHNGDARAEMEIEMCDAVVSFMCPLSLSRMEHPAKGRHCRHLPCFDAKAFLELSKPEVNWKCVHCNEFIFPDDLIIDPFFLRLLRKYTSDDRCIVRADGTDAPATADSTTPATAAGVVSKRGRRSKSGPVKTLTVPDRPADEVFDVEEVLAESRADARKRRRTTTSSWTPGDEEVVVLVSSTEEEDNGGPPPSTRRRTTSLEQGGEDGVVTRERWTRVLGQRPEEANASDDVVMVNES
ncbi:hypothetical protein HDU96_005550 [Phlyctochytrium bullatum]|nr:hypothetical protein HDU96_005550 [Phlyctochytrium bullatum]